jgi:hypothetical protein
LAEKLLILETARISLWCYPQQGIIHHVMHLPTHGDALFRALQMGTEAMRTHGATKWLSDDRLNGPLPAEDIERGNTEWFPGMKKAGWKHWALVQPERLGGQVHMSRVVESYQAHGVQTAVFDDPDAAMTWLQSQPR